MKQKVVLPCMVALCASLSVGDLSAQELCGQFETQPHASAAYSYHDGALQTIEIPLAASFEISCDDYSLSAVIESAIIGIDENGNELFTTGLEYPLAVIAPWSKGNGYTGSLSDTQYHFQWTFERRPDGSVDWIGNVAWIGGRFEQTDISGVALIRVPEPSACVFLIGLGASAIWFRGGKHAAERRSVHADSAAAPQWAARAQRCFRLFVFAAV